MKCPICQSDIEVHWKYCRICGNKIESTEIVNTNNATETEHEVELTQESSEPSEEPKSIEFDRDLYYKVLSTRHTRSMLAKRKSEVRNEIKALLNQVQSGLIGREYAVPKINKLKEEVSKLSEDEKEFKEIPTDLPVEVLLDEIEAAEKKMRKLEHLKSDDTISKEAIKEAKNRTHHALQMLKDQHSKVSGHIRSWLADLRSDLKEKRKDFQQLTIRAKIGEITDETFIERKSELVDKIETLENTILMVEKFL